MTIANYITLIIWAAAQITAVTVAYIRIVVKLNEAKMRFENVQQQIDANKQAFQIHEMQNEKSFDRFDKKIDDIGTKVDDIKNILIEKL